MSLFEPAGLLYQCENDDCPGDGEPVAVPRGKEAECPACGWMMMAVTP